MIGAGNHHQQEAKISHIRNPVLRVVAKIVSQTLFCKEEAARLRNDEILMLHYGLPPTIRGIYDDPPPEELTTNLGAVFAYFLVQRKFRALRGAQNKEERIGSLLTPIFQRHGLISSATSCLTTYQYFDEQFFRRADILLPGFHYRFHTSDGIVRSLRLPRPDLTRVSATGNIRFDTTIYYSDAPAPTMARRRGAPPHGQRDATAAFRARDPDVYDLPPYTGEYDLPEPPAAASADPHLTYIAESCRRNHSMLRRIWDAISCRRPSREDVSTPGPSRAAQPVSPREATPEWTSSDDE